jgi:hypothetical protein
VVNLSTTIYGTPTYNSGNAKFGSYGLSAGAIGADNVDNFFSSTGANGGALTTGTVEAWVKSTTSGSLKVIASHAGWWYLASDASGYAYMEYGWGSGTNTTLTSTTPITDGNWHHVAMVLVSGAGSLYVDGARVATSAVARNAVGMDATKRFVLGTHTNNSSAFLWPGSIDEVRISNVARYSGTTYTVPTAAFTYDATTVGIYHLENNGSSGLSYVSHVYQVNNATAANPTISVTDTPATGDILVLLVGANAELEKPTAVSGCGATWSRVTGFLSASEILDAWIGVGATSSGTVTATAAAAPRALAIHMVTGTTTTVTGVTAFGAGARTTPSQTAGSGQIVIGASFTDTQANSVTGTTPASGWTETTGELATSTRFMGMVTRAPATSETHNFTAERSTGTTYVSQLMLGDVSTDDTIDSQFSGSGTLTSALTGYQNFDSAFSGSGTLTSQFTNYQHIESVLSGSSTLVTTVLGTQSIDSQFSGEGTLVSVLTGIATIDSQFTGSGTLVSALSTAELMTSAFSGSGTLTSVFTNYKNITSVFSAEGVLYSELGYVVQPPELGTTPLGRLVSFNVSTSAVPLNPAEGSGATPSVSIGYIKGVDPEFSLGETNVLTHGTVGTYEGEIVRLSLPEGSDVASVSQDTLLTLLNTDLHLFPFIDAAPSVWTAARAIDYWTQQCGLFYDKVPGDCIAYASGYGHTDSYGASSTARFYEKLAGGTTATSVVGARSVKTLGSAVTGTTAFHELPEGSVAVSVPKNSKLVASIGLGLRGTGRTSTVSWNMLDAKDAPHTVSISATSAGLVTASVGGVPVCSTTVTPNGDYRLTFSIEKLSSTAVVGKLTVHTDDLAGTGALVYASSATVASYGLPAVLHLSSITHVSAGGSGAEMLRWGTYLTVADTHPLDLPAVQKVLSQTGKEFGFVSGYEGNVWAMLNEYCAIARLDVSFLESKMQVTPRNTSLSVPVGNFSRFGVDSERREKYKQVAVMNKQSVANTTGTAVFWRADSVYQLNVREVQEFTVQTDHSLLSVNNPVPVPGIEPFPYMAGAGQYVVTGADGYIIAPQWWIDYGGKIEVSLTEKEGEISIKMTAPTVDSVRAPYRISEGEADRPALYISGSGILNDPKEVHVGTGARNAKEGFDNVFESPFIAGPMETYDTAMEMASMYSSSVADVTFEIPNDFYTPSRFGQYPAGTRFTDGKRNYRIMSASQTHSRVSGNAVPHTTIGDYVASYPPGATIADEKARHTGATIKQFNIKPLRGSDDNA